MTKEIKISEDLLRKRYVSVVWSHKIHEKQADLLNLRHMQIQKANIFLSAVASTGIIALLFVNYYWITVGTSLLSIIVTCLSSLLFLTDYRYLVDKHKISAQKLLSVRNEIEVMIAEVMTSNIPNSEILNKLSLIDSKLSCIYEEAPLTTDKAVSLARQALKISQDNTFTEDEINMLLPPCLLRKE